MLQWQSSAPRNRPSAVGLLGAPRALSGSSRSNRVGKRLKGGTPPGPQIPAWWEGGQAAPPESLAQAGAGIYRHGFRPVKSPPRARGVCIPVRPRPATCCQCVFQWSWGGHWGRGHLRGPGTSDLPSLPARPSLR